MAVHQIDKNDLKVGTQVEQAEHPWAGPRTARRIAADHLSKNPKAYAAGKKGGCEDKENILILNQNIKVKTTRPKKKLPPPPQAPAWQTWGRELL